jgi:predicted transcriptional regulator
MEEVKRYNVRSLPRLARAVKARRLELGMTQAELALAADVSRKWISVLENGGVDGLELARVMRVLDALDAVLFLETNPVVPEGDRR